MIKSFKDSEAELLFSRERSKKIPATIHRVALRKLVMLDAAVTVDDLRVPPGNRLELLKGSRSGQHSIRINDQWRVCFVWRDGHSYHVEIIDYH